MERQCALERRSPHSYNVTVQHISLGDLRQESGHPVDLRFPLSSPRDRIWRSYSLSTQQLRYYIPEMGQITFRGDYKNVCQGGGWNEIRFKIPLDLIMRLSSLESYTDLQSFIDEESLGSNSLDTSLANRFGEGDERKAVLSPKPATCKPESRTVPLTNSMDPSLFYFPTCTRVDLCGGCCSSELLSCQPTQTEILNYQVIVTQYDGGAQLKYKGKEIVSVEQHLKCKCDCTVKEKVGLDHYSGARETTSVRYRFSNANQDCTRLQEYRAGECRCVCLNVDDERKCNADNDTKLWDSNNCVCACRENKECSTGLYFDQNSCKCAEIPQRRRHISVSEVRRRRGEVPTISYKPLPVLPLQREDRRSRNISINPVCRVCHDETVEVHDTHQGVALLDIRGIGGRWIGPSDGDSCL
uniref:Platelet-derived growth factor (PDGF) family profile domain-containing protein n=1 Tax=Timema poppense TaxID=170557 RepID=A0A7R9D7V7_TIMPO|nr:unnamed protein product [Timema poppensis]